MRIAKVDNDPEPSLINEKLSSLKLNTQLLFLSILCLLLTSTIQAQTSVNIGLTSDYLWRGISQSDKNIAASAGIDYASDSGFYLGSWASTLHSGSYELDLYAGFSTEKMI